MQNSLPSSHTFDVDIRLRFFLLLLFLHACSFRSSKEGLFDLSSVFFCSGLPVAIPAAVLLLRDPAVRAVLLAGSIPGIRAHRHVAYITHLSGMYIKLQ